MYSRFAVLYSIFETARQPSRSGGCYPLAGRGVNAVSSAPTSKRRKKTAGQPELRDFPISSLPASVVSTNRPVLKFELLDVGEWDKRAATQRGRLLLKPCGSFDPQHENLRQHRHYPVKPVQHSGSKSDM